MTSEKPDRFFWVKVFKSPVYFYIQPQCGLAPVSWPPVAGCHSNQPHGHSLTSAILITELLRLRAQDRETTRSTPAPTPAHRLPYGFSSEVSFHSRG